jgi:hypothetical protein
MKSAAIRTKISRSTVRRFVSPIQKSMRHENIEIHHPITEEQGHAAEVRFSSQQKGPDSTETN